MCINFEISLFNSKIKKIGQVEIPYSRVIEKYRFYRFCRQKMWKSDKNNINIGPDVWLKENAMFKFFPEIGFHIIVKNHSEFRLFFPISDGTRELPYYNKQQTSMATSWPIKFHTDAKTGVKSSEQQIMKSAKPIGSGYF